MKIRFFSSYPLAVALTVAACFFLLATSGLSALKEETASRRQRVESYAASANFPLLEKRLEEYRALAAIYKVKRYSAAEAAETLINFADVLREKWGAYAETDRPSESGGVMRLAVNFSARFKNASEFADFIKFLENVPAPVAIVSELVLKNPADNKKEAIFRVELAVPYSEVRE